MAWPRNAQHSLPRRELLTFPDYDAVTLSPLPVSPPEFHTTVYPVSNQAIMDAAQELAAGLKSRKYYTDTANFDLKCGVCGVGLKGEKGAREHAMQTGRELWQSEATTLTDRCRVWRVLTCTIRDVSRRTSSLFAV